MKNRIIINNESDDLSDQECLILVQNVVSDGRKSGNGECYTHLTVFTMNDGTKFNVYAKRNKRSDSFKIWKTGTIYNERQKHKNQ